jgi:hypothetical protein
LVNRLIVVAVMAAISGCTSGAKEEMIVPARPREPMAPVAHKDCVEANRRAALEPDLDVDSVPRLVAERPRAFAAMPDSIRRLISTTGSSLKANVVVDTLGRPVMRTFKVVESTHPWLARNLQQSMPTWRFRAARLAGCKVPRIYKFSATSTPRG